MSFNVFLFGNFYSRVIFYAFLFVYLLYNLFFILDLHSKYKAHFLAFSRLKIMIINVFFFFLSLVLNRK